MTFIRSKISFAVLAVFSTTIYANETVSSDVNSTATESITLSTIVVEAEQNSHVVGQATYKKDQLEQMSNAKKTIAEFLRVNPNVQFERDSLNGSNQASLSPEKISINGAQFYDNKFVVNGVNTSNTFDPVGENADTSFTGISNVAQTANINTDLLCELNVIDSNASAEHGDFLGGVISAKTCAPNSEVGRIHGSLNLDYTTSAWSRFNFTDSQEELDSEELKNVTSNQYHREYDIYGLSSTIYGNVNDQWGLSLNASSRNSIIPVKSGYSEKDIDTEENNNSVGIIAFYTPSKTQKYQFGVDHFDYNRNGYLSNNIRSDFTVDTVTNTFFVQSEHQFDQFKLENNLNYRTTDSARELDQDYSTTWIYSKGDKDWRPGSTRNSNLNEGSSGGDLVNNQSTLSYDLKATSNVFKLSETDHRLKFGIGYKHNKGSWNRPSEHTTSTGSGYATILNPITGKYVADKSNPNRGNLGNSTCATGDYLCSEADFEYKPMSNDPTWQNWNGQYLKMGNWYGAAKVSARQDQWSAYIEDEIRWNNIKATLGLRADYESLASNLNFAPRSQFEYRPLGSQLLRMTTGFNRYYGSTYLITELSDKLNPYTGKLTRDNTYSSQWNSSNNFGWILTPAEATSGIKATDLDNPYSDEFMLALDGELTNLQWGLKWVNRDFKDAIRQNSQTKSYENIDAGNAQTYTLSLRNIQAYEVLNTKHHLNLALSYVEDETYRSTYRAADSITNSNWAWVNGETYQVGTIPSKDSPFTARLNWLIQSSTSNWTWNNFLNYRSGSTNYTPTKNKIEIADGLIATVYEKENFPSKFTWDTRSTYHWNLANDQSLMIGLTISNVLNKHNRAVNNNNSVYSEEGRRFIADVSYKF